jgi:hypothetical protein
MIALGVGWVLVGCWLGVGFDCVRGCDEEKRGFRNQPTNQTKRHQEGKRVQTSE